MKRREFVATSVLAGLAPWSAAVAADGSPAKECYELRLYKVASAAKAQLMEDFFRQAAIPAWNRMGIGPVGVFRMLEGDDPTLYVLMPHKTMDSVITMKAKVMADQAFLKAGAEMLQSSPKDPAYQRMESWLLWAFDGMPKLEVPSTQPTRILQLRIYESHSVPKAQKKIAMFNKGGEIGIFRRVGMNPVFFGETIIGSKQPNLTYMLGFDNQQALDKAWAAFKADPAWLELKDKPEYQDTVSNITNILLRPADGSQI